jgi:hypothetical protein
MTMFHEMTFIERIAALLDKPFRFLEWLISEMPPEPEKIERLVERFLIEHGAEEVDILITENIRLSAGVQSTSINIPKWLELYSDTVGYLVSDSYDISRLVIYIEDLFYERLS